MTPIKPNDFITKYIDSVEKKMLNLYKESMLEKQISISTGIIGFGFILSYIFIIILVGLKYGFFYGFGIACIIPIVFGIIIQINAKIYLENLKKQ
jgi:hypothetical protein